MNQHQPRYVVIGLMLVIGFGLALLARCLAPVTPDQPTLPTIAPVATLTPTLAPLVAPTVTAVVLVPTPIPTLPPVPTVTPVPSTALPVPTAEPPVFRPPSEFSTATPRVAAPAQVPRSS